LRSQDVPARYVVGYSTGERVDRDTYRVRGLNAHAWVEVYFPELGWVRFDPTPGDARRTEERRRLREEGVSSEYDPGTSGSPEAQPDAETPTSTPTSTPSPTPTADGRGEYAVSLNRSAVPGAAVTVQVRAGETRVADAAVRVDERVVGVTGPSGDVETTLPYEASVTVSATGGETADGGALPTDGEPNASRTYDMPTNATITLAGERRVNATVALVATVDGVPVRNATVLLGPAEVERTDEGGRTGLALPPTPGNVTVGVERGAVTGSKTIAVDVVTVAVDPALGLPVALTPVEVRALVNGEPEPGATVTVGGSVVGETGVDGSVTAWLPADSAVPVSVTARGQTATRTVANPLANLAGVVALAIGAVGATAVAVRRSRYRPSDLHRVVASAFRLAVRALVGGLVGLADLAERALTAGRERLARTAEILGHLAAGERSVSGVIAALAGWLTGIPDRIRAVVPVGSGDVAGGRTQAGPTNVTEADRTVREGWERFLEHVSVERPDVHTPGQLAAHAVTVDGLPPDAVTTLRDEFRAVEYGPRPPDAAAPGIAAAVEAIEAATEDETGTTDDGTAATDDGTAATDDEAATGGGE